MKERTKKIINSDFTILNRPVNIDCMNMGLMKINRELFLLRQSLL